MPLGLKSFGEMFVYVTFYYKKHELGEHWWQITGCQISAGNMLIQSPQQQLNVPV